MLEFEFQKLGEIGGPCLQQVKREKVEKYDKTKRNTLSEH